MAAAAAIAVLVIMPFGLAELDTRRQRVIVTAVTGAQFLDAPMLQLPDSITLREEDMVSGYFAGGILYAMPHRQEPLL